MPQRLYPEGLREVVTEHCASCGIVLCKLRQVLHRILQRECWHAAELRIDGTEFTQTAHVDAVGAAADQCSSGLCLARDDDLKGLSLYSRHSVAMKYAAAISPPLELSKRRIGLPLSALDTAV